VVAADVSARVRPPFRRSGDGALVAGVARGLAAHLGVDPIWVRLAFGVLAVTGGTGLLCYGALWVLVPLGEETGRPVPARERLELPLVGLVCAGLALVLNPLGVVPRGAAVIALPVTALGVGLVWQQADRSQRRRWTGAGDGGGLGRVVLGVLLLVGGAVGFLAANADLGSFTGSILAVVLAVAGVGLTFAPWWRRVVIDLAEERRERIRSEERAELAAHLHDSVLQTLALIQRNAESPGDVQRLARSQERELRSWLFGDRSGREGGQLGAAIRAVAAEVEERHDIAIEVVAVGDMPLDERAGALVRAAREAMVNAAKFASVPEVAVYVEVEPEEAVVYVRDTGVGFDPDEVPEDRRGVSDSILGRMARHGGSASIRSAPGEGTEVELRLPRSTREVAS
jgi:signal transduction histidine kinase/phage shock protein PspC (stress-responsive transcriptional regulator)